MSRIETRVERALLAVGVAATVLLLLTVPDGEPILSGDMLPIAAAVGVAVYAGGGDDCGSCSCC